MSEPAGCPRFRARTPTARTKAYQPRHVPTRVTPWTIGAQAQSPEQGRRGARWRTHAPPQHSHQGPFHSNIFPEQGGHAAHGAPD